MVSSTIYQLSPLPNMKFKSFLSVTRTTSGGRLTGCYTQKGSDGQS